MPHRSIRPAVRAAAVATAAVAAIVSLATPGSAHTSAERGDLVMTVGFGTEPAYVGQPNSVQLVLERDGDPVVDLGDALDVEVTYGDAEPMPLELEPFFAVGGFGEPGDYRAWFIPTSAGEYSFHVTGTVGGEEVDETFTSGPDTFGDVESGSDLQYPVQEPLASDLVERIERESGRLADATERLEVAEARATHAADDASSARTIGMVGIAIGLLGVAAAGTAFIAARRATRGHG